MAKAKQPKQPVPLEAVTPAIADVDPKLVDPEHELNPDAYRVDDEPAPEEGWDKAGESGAK